ncbi:MAG TPA: hypothetical protein VG269_11765 [Tepidisphaeraceae bacterium]|nr:hypothetical protein [Tepidisphaeraceae bacterium]
MLQLDGANMITMRSVPSGASYETTFSINHLALTFLNQHHVVPAAKRAEIEKRRRRFTAMVEEVRGVIKSAPFSRRTIRARTETEIMVAGILLSALDAVKTPSRADFAAAEGYLEQAKSIAPALSRPPFSCSSGRSSAVGSGGVLLASC